MALKPANLELSLRQQAQQRECRLDISAEPSAQHLRAAVEIRALGPVHRLPLGRSFAPQALCWPGLLLLISASLLTDQL
eukprot:1653661-Alexandrium_andersonii.AAC.1